MLQRIEELANLSVGRGCAFAMIAIGTTMVGLSFDPHQCLKTGAVLSLFTALVLILKAVLAQAKRYDSTELWLLLEPALRPPQAIAQVVVARALKAAYFRFASYFAHGAAGLLLMNVMLAVAT